MISGRLGGTVVTGWLMLIPSPSTEDLIAWFK
jgi:hypothetical protein